MKAKERCRIAMTNGTPDRVPVIPQICPPHAIRMLGLDYEKTILEMIRRPELMNEYDFACAKAYGVDGMRAWTVPDPMDVVKVEDKWYGVNPRTGKRLGEVDFQGGGGILPSDEPAIHTQDDIDAIPVVPADEIVKSGRRASIE